MTRYYLLLIFYVIGLTGCDGKKNIKQPKKEELAQPQMTPIQNRKLMHALMDSALEMGNERAYNKVSSYYFLEKREQELFYLTFIMANKYKSAEACYNVYITIAYSTPEQPNVALKKMDSKTRNFALYYLLKSYELGFDRAKFYIVDIFGKNTPFPKSSVYLRKFCTD